MVTLKNIRQVYLDGKKYTIAESYRLINGDLSRLSLALACS